MSTAKRRRGTAIVELTHAGERGILVMSDGGDWLLPGGGADRPDETRFEAAIRELYEETGLRAAAALALFEHETLSLHRVCYIKAAGKPRIVDPNESIALGLCRPDLSVALIELLPGVGVPGRLSAGTRASSSASPATGRPGQSCSPPLNNTTAPGRRPSSAWTA